MVSIREARGPMIHNTPDGEGAVVVHGELTRRNVGDQREADGGEEALGDHGE